MGMSAALLGARLGVSPCRTTAPACWFAWGRDISLQNVPCREMQEKEVETRRNRLAQSSWHWQEVSKGDTLSGLPASDILGFAFAPFLKSQTTSVSLGLASCLCSSALSPSLSPFEPSTSASSATTGTHRIKIPGAPALGMQHGFPAFPGESPGAVSHRGAPTRHWAVPAAAEVSTGIAGEGSELPCRELLGNSCHALHSQPIYFAITSP